MYFFDQPTRLKKKRVRRSTLDLIGPNEEDATTDSKDQSDEPKELSGEVKEEDKPETSAAVFSLKDQNMMDMYRRTAPQLLCELAHVLSQHKWSDEGRTPHGLVNILSYTWQELTAGARLHTSQHTDKQTTSQSMDLTPRPLSANQKREREAAPSEVKPQLGSKVRMKKRKSRSCKADSSACISFSILNQSSKDQDCIIYHQETPSTEDIHTFTWAVKRLQSVKSPLKAQTVEQDLLLLRHYGDTQSKPKNTPRPITLFSCIPRIPEVKMLGSQRQKLHYRINDGSSFIYYPSGCVAVCQSFSGLPCGGFYTNVFTESESPVIIATITVFGRGTVKHRHSSAISAVWDQEGGLIFDKGNITKEWSWHSGYPKKKIVIQVSDTISLDLFSNNCDMLNFRCDNELVQLPLHAVTNSNTTNKMPYLQSNIRFISDIAQELLPAPSPCIDNISLPETRMSMCSRDVQWMVKDLDRPEEAPSLWRREGRAVRELRKIQQRAQCTLDTWMDFYCVAIGIRCPDMQRMPDVPPRSRLKREVQSAALPSLNSPETVQLQDNGPQQRYLSAPGQRQQESSPKISRLQTFATPQKKQTKEECPITQIGPLQFYGIITRESVILPEDPDQQTTCVPYALPFTPIAPVTQCPVLLRAALSGEGSRKRCCCSPSQIPLLADLEYDIFIMGQPAHSHQMLIVWVTCQNPYPHNAPVRDPLEQLYRRKNKHRTMPCTQSQMDSFRLVKYEISVPKPCYEAQKVLLQQRHNAAPGMVLMYIKGKLLFIGYIAYSDSSCPFKDLEKKISKARGDYRLGLSLPPDFKFSDKVDTDAKDTPQDTKIGFSAEEIENIPLKGPETTRQPPKDSYHKPKKKESSTRFLHNPVKTK